MKIDTVTDVELYIAFHRATKEFTEGINRTVAKLKAFQEELDKLDRKKPEHG